MRAAHLRRLAPLTFFALSVGAVACAGQDEVGSGSSDVTDSFRNPTDHGELQFGVPNDAEFTDEDRYHAWRFTLSAEAEIDLTTQLIAHNLDLSERVPVSLGDRVGVRGVYEWNDLGGLVHWTHHDPLGVEAGGWVRHHSREYG